jgi:predicted metal-dependent peptidase
VLWNQAGDYVINIIAVDSGYTLPEGALLDRKYDEMATEHVYDLLETENPDPPDQPTDEDGLPVGPTPGVPTDWVFESPNLTPSEIVQEEDSWEIAVIQAIEAGRKAGQLPAGIERLVEAYRKPTINWRAALRRFFSAYTKRDYSWGKVKKRLIGQNIYLPSLYSEDLDHLVLWMDTSASVTDDERAAFAAELNQILAEFDATITIIYCDAEIHKVDTFHTDQLPREIDGNFPGDGGTDIQPVLDYIDAQGLNPSCFVCLTDGGIYRTPVQPSYPCLVITTDIEIPIGDNVRLTL